MRGHNDDPANVVDPLPFSLRFECPGKSGSRTLAPVKAIEIAIGLTVLSLPPQ
jgi:hypothetical protein